MAQIRNNIYQMRQKKANDKLVSKDKQREDQRLFIVNTLKEGVKIVKQRELIKAVIFFTILGKMKTMFS